MSSNDLVLCIQDLTLDVLLRFGGASIICNGLRLLPVVQADSLSQGFSRPLRVRFTSPSTSGKTSINGINLLKTVCASFGSSITRMRYRFSRIVRVPRLQRRRDPNVLMSSSFWLSSTAEKLYGIGLLGSAGAPSNLHSISNFKNLHHG